MKRVVSLIIFLFIVFPAFCQYGNEWIEFGRPYFRIPVGSAGLYRISHAQLAAAGLLSADPETFQLFHRGVEQAIHVSGDGDGTFDAGDYIEFFGTGNDGTLDSTLYADPDHQPHRYYNLFSDTTSYFLTHGSVPGKRMSTYTASSGGLVPATHHLHEQVLVLADSYSGGIDFGDVQQTTFDEGEGWMGVQVLQQQEKTYVLEGITGAVTGGAKPRLEVLLTGRGPMVHQVEISAGTRVLSTLSFNAYQSYRYEGEVEFSDIEADGKLAVRIRVTGAAGPDRVSANYIRLVSPQELAYDGGPGKFFFLPADAANQSFLRIGDAPVETRLFDVTNPADAMEIASTFTGTVDAVIPASTARKIFAVSEVRSPATILRTMFRPINPALHDYVIVTHPSLRKPASGYLDPVKAYAEYRALPEGGGFDTLVVNIGQLYDQFNYGERSPRAIYQFLKYLVSVEGPEYLFLVGKGLDVNYGYARDPSAFPLYSDLVPTAGFPASDLAFSAGLGGVADVPAVATGRLTAMAPGEVAAYLDKVKAHEARPFEDLTRKNILHISGGIEEHEPEMFRNILKDYASVATGLYLGASVRPVAKQSTAVRLVNIAAEVNSGVGMITFFGHSAPNSTDFDIGMVSDPVMGYDNKGKYPFLLMNGCNTGSCFLNTTIFGEDWITARDRGAVGFIAHTSFGLLSGLQRYSSTFYNVAFGDSAYIKRTVGEVQQEVARRYFAAFGSSPKSVTQVQQMVLLGDPAMKIFGASKPDYFLAASNISISSFNGEAITAYSDSFRINIPVRNFGIANEKNIRVEIRRQYNDQPVRTYDTIISPVLHSDTISFIIRQGDDTGFGINTFSISVDADDLVDELKEDNNTAVFEYFIPLNSTRNLYPYDYSIVNTAGVDLSFQYTDLQGTAREYLVEIDTTKTFDSGFKKQFTLTATVLGKQRVSLLAADTMVYYWRTKIAQPLETESREWTVSSFTYIDNGPEGWAQVDFPQLQGNTAYGLVADPVLRRLRYEETTSDVAIRTFSSASGNPTDSVSVRINDVEFNLLNQGAACRNNTLNLIAFDRRSTQPYAGINFKWYEILYEYGGRKLICGREPYVINSFKPDELITGDQDDLAQYVDNVAAGDSVVLFTIGDAGFVQWPAAARTVLAELGIAAEQLDPFQNGDPVVIFGRKGSTPGSARVFHAPSPQTTLDVNETIAGRFTAGTLSSVIIGPAQRWDELHVGYHDAGATDEFSFSLVGIGVDGVGDTLRKDLTSAEDLSFIDAVTYPHIRLVLHTRDDINLTPVQLSKWLVVYEPVAEGLVFYRGPYQQRVVQEGEVLAADFGFVNISGKTFADSLQVRYALSGAGRPADSPSITRIRSPLPGDTTLFTISFPTREKAGMNDVEVFVNPRVEKEQSYDNNVMLLKDYLQVLSDGWNPVLEVTFDGRHIIHEEFVSDHPEIVIRLWDENRFLLKEDTTGISIFLRGPCGDGGCDDFSRIHFSRADISWSAAAAASDFRIVFSPQALAEGTYTLRVEAMDASGNPAGEQPYEVAFRIQHSHSVIVSSPYPNPFYLDAAFDVMVAGDAAGSSYELHIVDLNGTLVAMISNAGTGFRTGLNVIRWNGSGSDGDSLPSGIYLYRLFISGSGGRTAYQGKLAMFR